MRRLPAISFARRRLLTRRPTQIHVRALQHHGPAPRQRAAMSTDGFAAPATNGSHKIRFIPLSYSSTESQASALRLILALRPEWENGRVELIRFTDGITNTLLKVVNKEDGLTEEEIDNEAVLLRAYGQGTDLIIDRERETQNHELLSQHGLAPALLARFHNGMLYRFIRGAVTSPADLRREDIWRAVARRLAEWHAVVPCIAPSRESLAGEIHGSEASDVEAPTPSTKDPALQAAIDQVAPGKPAPNVWTVMQKWIYALPVTTDAEKKRQADLQKELTRLVAEFSDRPGLGENNVSVLLRSVRSGKRQVNGAPSLCLLTVICSVGMSSSNHSPQRHLPTRQRRLALLTTSTRPRPPLPSTSPTTSPSGVVSSVSTPCFPPDRSVGTLSVNTSAATFRTWARTSPR